MSLLIFDDRNSTLSFSIQPAWIQGGTSPDFDGTSTWATNPGASFTFQFTGVSISVFGPIQSGSGSQTAYSIDRGDAQLVTAVPPVGVEFIFQQLLFNRSGLSRDVLHTLSVTTVMVTNATYYVDYIEVQAAPSVTTTLASGNSITTSTTKWTDIPWINTSAIQVSSTSEAFNLNTASPKLVDSTHPTSITPILVAALGGIIFLLLIASSALFLRWRRHRSMYLESIAVRSVTADTPFFTSDDADNSVVIS